MRHTWERTALLVGEEAVAEMAQKSVAIFGVGGVGAYAAEAIARSGVGRILLYDSDTVSPTNINRQLIALHSTIGQRKVDVMAARILDINPECVVETYYLHIGRETRSEISLEGCDYVVDAVDMVAAKLIIIDEAVNRGIPVVSAMGAGNKLDAHRFEVVPIRRTKYDPLSRVMRKELRRRGIHDIKVVYSPDPPLRPRKIVMASKKIVPGSVSYVPATMGMLIAGEVIKDLMAAGPLESIENRE